MAATYTCIALFDIIIMIALMTMMAFTKKSLFDDFLQEFLKDNLKTTLRLLQIY